MEEFFSHSNIAPSPAINRGARDAVYPENENPLCSNGRERVYYIATLCQHPVADDQRREAETTGRVPVAARLPSRTDVRSPHAL